MSDTLQTILDTGVIAIIRADSPEGLVECVKALADGGVKASEITLNTPGALDAISALAAESAGKFIIGAGTVLNADAAKQAIDAGAEFLVSPHAALDVIAVAKQHGKLACPGALTPTEVVTAWDAGADLIKVFPAERMGGPAYIKSLKAPLPHVSLVAVGGVNLDNMAAYFQGGASAVGLGSQLLTPQIIKDRKWGQITAAARESIATAAKAKSYAPGP